ncbi:MAG TPA: T9SS type A sorting domain-containing protein, partial [Candidatus Eisenbacteria bacterium]|nr:T9SS type A sorting domain-containing protein [Candidatus Eisenbacteria bacterium]
DAAHEVGHMLGRKHVNCTGGEGGPDLNYPYAGGKIGGPASDPTRYYGLSAALDRPAIVRPNIGDLMGYCEPRWLSNYTLNAIWAYRQAHPGLAPGLKRMQAAASVSGDFLAVFGQIDQATEDVSLTSVTRAATVGDIPPLVPGPYHLRLLDEHGSTLSDHAFSATSTSEGGSNAVIGQVVDFEAGTRTIEIYSDASSRVLVSVPVSENPPTVTITTQVAGANLGGLDAFPLEWIGSDLDFDTLHYDVYYTPDGGSTWQLLVTGLSKESVVIQSSQLKGTGGAETGYFRIVASDGVLTGSDQAGPMTVDDKAPFVTVLHPSSTNFFRFGQTVTLEGWGLDLEDGTLDDSHFAWSSNRSGPLGTGRLVHLTGLPSGIHTITLGVTDMAGLTNYTSVVVTVGPEVDTNSPPAFTSVSPATIANEGDAVILSASAGDPDAGQSIVVRASGYPADLLLTQGSAVMPATAQATVTGTLGYSDGDQNPTKYTVDWTASDGTLAATASTELSVMDVVPIDFVLTPGTLNLRSMGRWVTGYLEPPSPYTAADIEAATALLNGSIAIDGEAPSELGDHDGDGVPDLMVKFDRAALELKLSGGDHVKVVVTGAMAGHYFIGTDYIRVIRAVVTSPAAGTSLTPGGKTMIAWTTPSGVKIESVALLTSLNGGTDWNLEASGLPNIGRYEWNVPDVRTAQGRVAVVLVESADETGYLVDGVVGTSGLFSIGTVTGVDESAGVDFALRVVRPNPTQDELRVTFGLPDAHPAKVEVFSVSGRRVAVRDVGDMGPGFHTVVLDEKRELASGVYLVRLTQAGKKLTTRAVVVR